MSKLSFRESLANTEKHLLEALRAKPSPAVAAPLRAALAQLRSTSAAYGTWQQREGAQATAKRKRAEYLSMTALGLKMLREEG
jgi:hypothetical protein